MLATALASLLLVALCHGSRPEQGLIDQRESYYGNIKIYQHRDRAGRRYLLYKPSRLYMHTRAYVDHPLLNHYVLQSVNVGMAFGAKRWLVLGVAGGAIFNTLQAWRSDLEMTGVDIDPEALKISRRYFRVPQSVRLVAQDARQFLVDTKQRFDFIFVDLAQGEFIPGHCITSEFYALVHERLSAKGVMAVNTNLRNLPPLGAASSPIPTAWHAHAAMYAAGFRSLFHNDIFLNGNVYAFKQRLSHRQLKRSVGRMLVDRAVDPNIRAALAGAYLKTVPISRTSIRAFSDDWTPQTLLHRKFNTKAYARNLKSLRPDRLKQASLIRHAFVSHAKDAGFFGSRSSPGRVAFCSEVERLFSEASNRVSMTDLAVYTYHPLCSPAASRSARPAALRSYLRGLQLYSELKIERALPLLLRAISLLDEPSRSQP